MRRLVLAAVLAGVALSSVSAAGDPIKERQALLKEMGRATRPVGAMLKGDASFDLATVQAALDTYIKNAKQLPNLFPPGSDKGGDTEALPVIWKRHDEFTAIYAKLERDATAARAAITDEASFKANFPGVVKNCSTCHDTFRQKK
ncbi:cytochrome c [Ancylobacter sp. 6x-1]|uniref:Cytochrome c n=1 Tax=Ancylobacter crimeensis TaxID=2579147 RepID=A0ABT0DA76_9HYPH|nr:cytochrome c [Ancylobacter crimeensis]MCK0196860.1 cytochrome c [Ancylobacter crimeensis]